MLAPCLKSKLLSQHQSNLPLRLKLEQSKSRISSTTIRRISSQLNKSKNFWEKLPLKSSLILSSLLRRVAFTEKESPPMESTGTTNRKFNDSKFRLTWANSSLGWMRASNLMKDSKIILNGISPCDIHQGELGNCYFLSSVSALAEYPERVARLLLSQEGENKGCYAVALNINGSWKKIFIDDNFPVRNKRLLFGHSASSELWAMILEKAYAKAYGGYWNIGHGGVCTRALKDLTGAPTEYVTLTSKTDLQQVWDQLYYSDQNKYVITCGSKGQGEAATDMGIITGHAYTILACHLFNGTEKVS